MSTRHKTLRDLQARMKELGLTVVAHHQSRHHKFRVIGPDGVEKTVICPTKWSDHRSERNWLSDMRRHFNLTR